MSSHIVLFYIDLRTESTWLAFCNDERAVLLKNIYDIDSYACVQNDVGCHNNLSEFSHFDKYTKSMSSYAMLFNIDLRSYINELPTRLPFFS